MSAPGVVNDVDVTVTVVGLRTRDDQAPDQLTVGLKYLLDEVEVVREHIYVETGEVTNIFRALVGTAWLPAKFVNLYLPRNVQEAERVNQAQFFGGERDAQPWDVALTETTPNSVIYTGQMKDAEGEAILVRMQVRQYRFRSPYARQLYLWKAPTAVAVQRQPTAENAENGNAK